MSAWWRKTLSSLDARVLRATDPLCARSAARIAREVGCGEDVVRSVLGRLRDRMGVESDLRSRPTVWRRTCYGDVALEHQP